MDDQSFLEGPFEASRAHLRTVAYRMLGSRSDAEDAVQEARLRLQRADVATVQNLRGWLTTVVARVCLDMLRARRKKREVPIEDDAGGTISPHDGGLDPEHQTMMADALSVAAFVVLEKLNPAERVSFVLHDMFDVSFDEIAALMIAFRPRAAEPLAVVPCRPADVTLAAAACASAYLITAALQAVGGPWSWSSSVEILMAMGSDDSRLATAGPVVAAIIIVRACVLAPVGEEVLFRGALYAWLRRRFPPGAAIPVSAAAHAAIHGFPAILPLAFVIGLGFGWVRERSGSTVPTIIVHALHNAAMIGWAYYVTGWTARLPAWGGASGAP